MQPTLKETTPLWHTLPTEEVLSRLESTSIGLTKDEAAARLAEHGCNELEASRHISPWAIFFEQFKNVLIVILLVATALSAFVGHGIEGIAIAVIVICPTAKSPLARITITTTGKGYEKI